MDSTTLTPLIHALSTRANSSPWRRLVLLKGDGAWGRRCAAATLQATDLSDIPWVGDCPPGAGAGISADKAGTLLGREFGGLVLDLSERVLPDALGACAGTVRAGGFLFLLVDPCGPAARECPRFLLRLLRVLENHPGTICVEQSGNLRVNPVATFSGAIDVVAPPFRTQDQAEAVAAVEHLAQGHRRRPLVLVADRGRGKSAALGIAAARLLLQGIRTILLTGPRLDAVLPALDHAAALLPDAVRGRGHLEFGSHRLEFVPPDALLLGAREADLLLVDEAAAIPAALLEQLLRRYSRIGFSTTIHGYEGSGRGFALRFRHTLDQLTPDWRELRMRQPIRWAAGDPLENAVFNALLLDAEAAKDDEVRGLSHEHCRYEILDRDRLVADERLLEQVFGLLVLAHYRTRPRDLLHLLDGEAVSIHLLRAGNRVLATLLATDEGGLAPDIAFQVSLGRRRLHGHLLPQTLCQHLGLVEAATLRLRRVIRIAVHPALQNRGLGSRLLRELEQATRQDGLDGCGASFAADSRLLRFWRRSGFSIVRLGVSRETASGSHSAGMLLSFTDAGHKLLDTARHRFMEHLPFMFGDALRDLDPFLGVELMASGPKAPDISLTDQDGLDLAAFAFGHRRHEVCPAPLHRLAQSALCNGSAGNDADQEALALLLARVLQNRSWKQCADLFGLSGRKAAETRLRKVTADLLDKMHGTTLEAIVARAKKAPA